MAATQVMAEQAGSLQRLQQLLGSCQEALDGVQHQMERLQKENVALTQAVTRIPSRKSDKQSARSSDDEQGGAEQGAKNIGRVSFDSSSDANYLLPGNPGHESQGDGTPPSQLPAAPAALPVVPAPLPGSPTPPSEQPADLEHLRHQNTFGFALEGGAVEQQEDLVDQFDLHAEWQRQFVLQHAKASTNHAIVYDLKKSKSRGVSLMDVLRDKDAEEMGSAPRSKCILHPESLSRTVWDLVCTCMVVYDAIMIPMLLLSPSPSDFLKAAGWVTRILWTADLFLSFFTGYIEVDGRIQMNRRRIILNYARSWMCLDAFISILDWVDFASAAAIGDEADVDFSGGDEAMRIGRLSRLIRAARLVRLLRMLKIVPAFQNFLSRYQGASEKLRILGHFCRTVFIVLFMAHVLACMWFGIGEMNKAAGDAYWFQDVEGSLMGDLYSNYITSMHWSLTQFQGGMDEFVATNTVERTFVVVTAIFAFCIAAAFVSRLTSLMTELHMLSRIESDKLRDLRRFLRQNKISSTLAVRLSRSAQFNMRAGKKKIEVSSVELLSQISESLLAELYFELFASTLEKHRFFERYMEECPMVMHRLCNEACHTKLRSAGDMVFAAGDVPAEPKLYILTEGDTMYIDRDGYPIRVWNDGKTYHYTVFICEVVLWVKEWAHRGILKVTATSSFLEVDAHKFIEAVGHYHNADFNPRKYASAFLSCLKLYFLSGMLNDLAMNLDEEESAKLEAALEREHQKRK